MISDSDVTAYELRSARLLLRCWREDDAPSFRALLDRNDQALRPFITWMRDEPAPLEHTRARLAGYRLAFDEGRDFRYGMFDAADERLIGELMLSTRTGEGSREVGYLVDQSEAGKGFASEASAMAIRLAFQHSQVDRVELHCSPRNRASVRIAEKLGFRHIRTLPAHYRNSEGDVEDSMIWMLNQEEWDRETFPASETQAFDKTGRRLF